MPLRSVAQVGRRLSARATNASHVAPNLLQCTGDPSHPARPSLAREKQGDRGRSNSSAQAPEMPEHAQGSIVKGFTTPGWHRGTMPAVSVTVSRLHSFAAVPGLSSAPTPAPPCLDCHVPASPAWTRALMTRQHQNSAELAEAASADSVSTSAPTCSHCGWVQGKGGEASEGPFFCGGCRALMPPDASVGEFALFGLDPGFDVDVSALEQRYKQLQKKLHPDKFASSTNQVDRERSAEWSARVIDAYYTLLRPLSRARCLMRGRAGAVFDNSESTIEDQELLMEIMETRERIEEADDEELAEMKIEFTSDLERIGSQFDEAYERGDVDSCQEVVHRMTYCCRILEEINNRL